MCDGGVYYRCPSSILLEVAIALFPAIRSRYLVMTRASTYHSIATATMLSAVSMGAPSAARLATRKLASCAGRFQVHLARIVLQQPDEPCCRRRCLAIHSTPHSSRSPQAHAGPALSCSVGGRAGMGIQRMPCRAAASNVSPADPARQGRGALIVLEGIDRCGKSTQSTRLAEHLRAQGVSQIAPGVQLMCA